MSTAPTAAERILAQQRNMQGKVIVCPQCGGEHFYEVQATHYFSGGMGSVEIQADTTDQTFPLLKCAGCNYPVMPKAATGRRAGGVYEKAHVVFRQSIELGQDFLKANTPKAITDHLLETMAGKETEDKVTNLVERVGKLEKDLGATGA